jgi:CRP-like cAMP-binding protein
MLTPTPPITVAELRLVPYFARLNDEALAGVARLVVARAYIRGDLIQVEGERCDGLWIVRSGRVRVFKTSPEGREQVLALIGPGESFNDVPVFDGGANVASAEAVEAATAVCLRRDDVQALLEREPTFAVAVIRVLGARLRHMTGLVEDLSFRNVAARVAKILLGQASDPEAGRLTQSEMAAIAGTAREVVGRALKALEQEGVLQTDHGRIVILNRARLEEIAGL